MTPLSSLDQWQSLLEESEKQSITVLKHSNSCPISAAAYDEIAGGLEQGVLSEPLYLVIVQDHREVSNQIAEDLEVRHESPQILVIKNKAAVYHASHRNITADATAEAVEK